MKRVITFIAVLRQQSMYWGLAASLVLTIVFSFASPVLADWTHPLSFSNAQLKGKDFSGQSLQASEMSNANMELTNFAGADLRGAVMSASVMTKANLHAADLSNAMVDQVNSTLR